MRSTNWLRHVLLTVSLHPLEGMVQITLNEALDHETDGRRQHKFCSGSFPACDGSTCFLNCRLADQRTSGLAAPATGPYAQ